MSQGLSFAPVLGLVRADGPDLDVSRGLAIDVKDIGLGRIRALHHVDDITKFGFGHRPTIRGCAARAASD